MAVLIEALSVVVRRDAIAQRYAGGWEVFVDEVPNRTLSADDTLARVGFMQPNDARAFVSKLEKHGLTFLRDGRAVDLAVVDQVHGPTTPVDWLNIGDVEIDEGTTITIGWTGEPDGRVSLPDGWTPDPVHLVRHEDMDDRAKFLRHENGVDVYLDLRTGKEVFSGRPQVAGGGDDSAFNALERIILEALQLEAEAEPLKALRDVESAVPIYERLEGELLPSARAWAEGEAKHMAMSHFVVGVISRILSRPEEAELALREANRLQPGMLNTLRELVRCLGEQDRSAEALPFAEEAAKVAPMDAGAWGNLAMCLIQCGKMEEAREALREALLIDPEDPINRTIRDNYFPEL